MSAPPAATPEGPADAAPSLAALHRQLAAQPRFADLPSDALVPLPTKGVSHDHIRIASHGLLLRIPRFSQWGAAPAQQLAYETAAFSRAAPSGHTPAAHGHLPVSAGLPQGALIIEEIVGRPPRLPADLPALAEALAALHRLPLLPTDDRPPLQTHDNPIAATLAVIERQATDLPLAELLSGARDALAEELQWARQYATAEAQEPQPLAFVGTDTHPGNFLIDARGKAWFLDLEKALYGAPAIDLAHTTLATSTGWDPDCATDLSAGDITGFYRSYLQAVDPDVASRLAPVLLPLRRLTWLRTITWFVRWHARWADDPIAARQPAPVARHISRHIARSLEPTTIAAARREWLGPTTLALI